MLNRLLRAIRARFGAGGTAAPAADPSGERDRARERRDRADALVREAMAALDSAEACFAAARQTAATDSPESFPFDGSDRAYFEGVLDAERATTLLERARLLRTDLPKVEWGFVEPEVAELQRHLTARLDDGQRWASRPMADFVGRTAAFDAIEQVRAARQRLRPHLDGGRAPSA